MITYRNFGDQDTWFANEATVNLIQEYLPLGIFKGIGEFHIYGGQTGATVVSKMLELAELNPKVKIILARSAFANPKTVAELLEKYPNLWAEIAFRRDVAGLDGEVDSGWRELFLRHSNRIMLGADTFTASVRPPRRDVVVELRQDRVGLAVADDDGRDEWLRARLGLSEKRERDRCDRARQIDPRALWAGRRSSGNSTMARRS